MKQTVTDVVIVGTGAAGLFAALCLPKGLQIKMITKDEPEHSDSYLAQGGISTLKGTKDYEAYYEDTMRAGRYENSKEAVDTMIKESPSIIKELIDYGVNFDRDGEGELLYTREGAHSTFRILHHKDITGKEITSTLLHQVKQRKNISLQSHVTMIDWIKEDNCCNGIIVKKENQQPEAIVAKATIVATGGIGGLFEASTNYPHITGDSFAIAIENQVELENLNYIQIHPTVLYSNKPGRKFLISESVRGEGAYLVNEKKERFVNELLPRDVVTEAIQTEMKRTHTNHVYLSMEHMKDFDIEARFPNIYARCKEEGYDCKTDLIPVTPAQHYIMGGIKATINGETSLKALYAVGETACNGVHGANRLASNSLLESLVFAKRAARTISDLIKEGKLKGTTTDCIKNKKAFWDFSEKDRAAYFKRLVIGEIKRRDEQFYDKWYHNESGN